LPSPEDRRRIRVEAGITQQEIADRVYVERTTIARWERRAGYAKGARLPGREPSGDARRLYGMLLAVMSASGREELDSRDMKVSMH
jgi:transcriptional regulator with XRE-family HTH domain